MVAPAGSLGGAEVPPAAPALPAATHEVVAPGAGVAPGVGVAPAVVAAAPRSVPAEHARVLMITDCLKAVHAVAVQLANPPDAVPDVEDESQKLIWPKLEVPRDLARMKSGHSHLFPGTTNTPKPSAHFFQQYTNWIKAFETRRDAMRPARVKIDALEAEAQAHAVAPPADQPPRALFEIQAELAAARNTLARAEAKLELWRWVPLPDFSLSTLLGFSLTRLILRWTDARVPPLCCRVPDMYFARLEGARLAGTANLRGGPVSVQPEGK